MSHWGCICAECESLRIDAKRYRYLLDHCQTTGHLWNLLARGDKGTIADFNTMVDRIMASQEAAYQRGRRSVADTEGKQS